jgi:hypothetical protein
MTNHPFDDNKSVIRLYNNKGEHKLSILPCDYVEGKLNCDLATPEGAVLYCGISEDLLNIFISQLGIEEDTDFILHL